jgi:hypothetical protein
MIGTDGRGVDIACSALQNLNPVASLPADHWRTYARTKGGDADSYLILKSVTKSCSDFFTQLFSGENVYGQSRIGATSMERRSNYKFFDVLFDMFQVLSD